MHRCLCLFGPILVVVLAGWVDGRAVEAKEDAAFYRERGLKDLKRALKAPRYEGKAKNIIYFVGDGLGVSTHTMSRIYKGQKKGKTGEEESLVWEDWDYSGLIKTYNTDTQVPDSAGTATAMFSGVKTRAGMLGLDGTAAYNVCAPASIQAASVTSLADWATGEGKEVGVVSTARLTHATPGAMYSHCPMRDWEADVNLPTDSVGCIDIATQLIESMEEGKVVVALGGGRRNFQTVENGGRRSLKDLVNRWRQEENQHYMETSDDLASWDRSGRALGLFSMSHMDYEVERTSEQPSLAEMTRAALERLERAPNGFLLMVEGGRIDHAHHANRAKMAMEETLALEEAVEVAMSLTKKEETLTIVTADHSHAVTINGYPKRGNSILGSVMRPETGLGMVTPNGLQPYSTISYANGPGYNDHFDQATGFWKNISEMDTQANSFRQMASFPLSDETHGGEDVSVYAIGPQAHLVTGVHEQSYLAHLAAYAGCLQKESLGCPTSGANKKISALLLLLLLPLLI